jgi:hypothetical protein
VKPLRQTLNPGGAAEGNCLGLPYDTDLVSINGVSVHFWVEGDDQQLAAAAERITRERDVVGITWSKGKPKGFWAHEDIK